MTRKAVNKLRATVAKIQGHEKQDLGGGVFCHGGPDVHGTCLFKKGEQFGNELFLDPFGVPTLDKLSMPERQVWPPVASDFEFEYSATEISNLCIGLEYQAKGAVPPASILSDLENAHDILSKLIQQLGSN